MKHTGATPVAGTSRPHVLAVYCVVITRFVRSPALWLFLAAYLLALVIYVPAGGTVPDLLYLFVSGLYALLITVLVFPFTAGAPPAAWEEPENTSRARLWIQLVLMALFLALYVALTVVIFTPGSVPSLGPFLLQHSILLVPLAAVVGVPVVCLLPLGLMRLLGVSWRELGIGRGYHAFRVAALGCSIPIGLLVVFFALGHFTLSALGIALGKAFLIAALPEEALFRGVLVTRLVRLLGVQWGVALALGIFALIHLEIDLSQDGSLLLALADMVMGQAVIGLLLITVFMRTRSLLSSVVLHTVLDSFGNLFRF